jgi:shikimate kinase
MSVVPEDPQSDTPKTTVRLIALTGFMGAGKTSIGRALATLLGWPFVDLDQEIERREKISIAEIFRRDSEPRFREIEAETLGMVLRRLHNPTVIALGGGTYIPFANAELLASHGAHVVFLHAGVDQLLERCRVVNQNHPNFSRPLAADPHAFRSLYAQRLPRYLAANITVQAGYKTIHQLAAEIASALRLGTKPV